MSIHTRRNYVWLSSVCRDIRREAIETTKNPLVLEGVEFAISSLATALEGESEGFDKKQFLQNIYESPIEEVGKFADKYTRVD